MSAWPLGFGTPIALSSVNGRSVISMNRRHPVNGGMPAASWILWTSIVRDMAW